MNVSPLACNFIWFPAIFSYKNRAAIATASWARLVHILNEPFEWTIVALVSNRHNSDNTTLNQQTNSYITDDMYLGVRILDLVLTLPSLTPLSSYAIYTKHLLLCLFTGADIWLLSYIDPFLILLIVTLDRIVSLFISIICEASFISRVVIVTADSDFKIILKMVGLWTKWRKMKQPRNLDFFYCYNGVILPLLMTWSTLIK